MRVDPTSPMTVAKGARATRSLVLVKLVHTTVWAVMAAAILALPVVALRGHLGWALALTNRRLA